MQVRLQAYETAEWPFGHGIWARKHRRKLQQFSYSGKRASMTWTCSCQTAASWKYSWAEEQTCAGSNLEMTLVKKSYILSCKLIRWQYWKTFVGLPPTGFVGWGGWSTILDSTSVPEPEVKSTIVCSISFLCVRSKNDTCYVGWCINKNTAQPKWQV